MTYVIYACQDDVLIYTGEEGAMYHFLSVLSGVFAAVMVVVNGELSSYYGLYSSTVVIHIIGLIFVLLISVARRERIFPAEKQRFYLYLGGVLGVITVVFCNFAFSSISVSAILALGLLGQSLTSLIFDRYGFLNMPKHPFSKPKLLGIAFIILGIVLMLINSKADALIPIVLSLLTGVSIVVSRTLNAALARNTSVLTSTVFNYITGLCVSAAVLLIAGTSEPMMQMFSLSPKVWIYTGGIIGVCMVSLLNAVVCKISSFYMTLLLFAGQVFAGVALDGALTGSFSVNSLIGGFAITAGLAQNLWIDKRAHISPAPGA